MEWTHSASIAIFSKDSTEEVEIRFDYSPDMAGDDIIKLGYKPAAYGFIDDYILPAVDKAILEWQTGPMMRAESPCKMVH